MFDVLKNGFRERWEQFKEGRPGRRFEERYHRRHEKGDVRFGLGRLLYIAAGVLVMLAGVVMLPAPGPGMAVIVVGLSLLGSEFLVIARFMDWGEVRLWRGFGWTRRTWRRASLPARLGLALLALVVAVALGYGFYRFVFARWV